MFMKIGKLDLQINGGLSILNSELYDKCPNKGQLEDTLYVKLTTTFDFYSYSLPKSNFWMSIDNEKDYILANQSWNGI